MSKKGATCSNFEVVGNVGSGAGGKAQQHDLRAIGLPKSIVEPLMKEHFGNLDMLNLTKEQREVVNGCFLQDIHRKMEENGLVDMSSLDPDDRRVMGHVDPELTPSNEFLIVKPLEIYLDEELKPMVKEMTGRGVQKNCTPFKEDVVVTNKDTTMEDVVRYAKAIKEEFGWTPVQIYIHHDEGHTDKQTGEWKENYHAHIIFDTISHDTGKTIQMNRVDMSRRQTILAESLGMERGENSSDVAHMASMQFKEEQMQADSRLAISMSVLSVGQNPIAIMVDDIKRKIGEIGALKRAQGPNHRPMINLLRPIAKCLNLNPTRRCADAIYEGLQRNPEKILYVANQLGVNISNNEGKEDHGVFEKEVKEALYRKAVWCGKINEDAKSFRPLLHCAKELGVDLVPVMLNPVMETLENISSLPISVETNNQLWRAVETYDNGKPMALLQNAQEVGLDDLKSQAEEAVQYKDEVFADIDKNISDTLEIVGSSKSEVLKEGIRRAVEEIQERGDDITASMVRSLGKLSNEIGLRPSETIAIKMDEHMSERGRQLACGRFGLPEDTDREQVCNAALALAKQYDDSKDYSSNNMVVCHFKPPFGYRYLAEDLLKHVDIIADKAKCESKMMEKLETVADHFNLDFMEEVKRAVENGEQTIKEKMNEKVSSQLEVIEGAKKVLEGKDKALKDAREAVDELEVRLGDKRLEEAQLEASIKTLRQEKHELSKELGKEPKDRSVLSAVVDAANKGIRAIGELLEGKKEKDVKEIIRDMATEITELKEQVNLFKQRETTDNVAAKRDGIAEGMMKMSKQNTDEVISQLDSVSYQAQLMKSEHKIDELTRKNKMVSQKSYAISVDNDALQKIVATMMSSQPKAVQVVYETKGFSLQNILDAIKDKVIKCFTGELIHPDFRNDPFKVQNKDIVIKVDCPEPLIDDVPLKQMAMDKHQENVYKSSKEAQQIHKLKL